jgi:hypothetical protein
MPPRKGRWRASTRRAWEGWWTSGKASVLDAAGLEALARLMALIDKAEAQDWPLGLTREIRLQEAALLRNTTADVDAAATEMDDDGRVSRLRKKWIDFNRRRRTRHEAEGLTEDEAASLELAALTED